MFLNLVRLPQMNTGSNEQRTLDSCRKTRSHLSCVLMLDGEQVCMGLLGAHISPILEFLYLLLALLELLVAADLCFLC